MMKNAVRVLARVLALVSALALAALSAGAARADIWHTVPPTETFVTFGVAENDEGGHFGFPLFVCEKTGISVEFYPNEMRASPRWKPPAGRVSAEIAGTGPSGPFSSGPLPVSFTYNKEREMWTLTGPIAIDNPLWQGLPSAKTLNLTVRRKRDRLTTSRLATTLPTFLGHCREFLARR